LGLGLRNVRPVVCVQASRVLKKSQPEEFDLAILGGGTGSSVGRKFHNATP
jgi:hypothetical protein